MKTTTRTKAADFAAELRGAAGAIDTLGDFAGPFRKWLQVTGRIFNGLEATKTAVSLDSSPSAFQRLSELAEAVDAKLKAAMSKRMAFMKALKPRNDKDVLDFIGRLRAPKPQGATIDVELAQSPAALAYAEYSAELFLLSYDMEILAHWLECWAAGQGDGATRTQEPVNAVLVGEQAEQLEIAATKSTEAAAKLPGIQIDTTAAVINSAKARKAAEWTKQELERKKKNAQKTGRKNQRNGEKNGNGRKTDAALKNQIMTEVRQTMRKNNCTQSNACKIVANKHLKANGKTPIFSKRTIENWMSEANTKKTKSP